MSFLKNFKNHKIKINPKNNKISNSKLKGFSKEEFLEFLPRHKNFNRQILKIIKEMPEILLQNNANPTAKKINRMMKEIFREAERMRQFTRTKLSDTGILYSSIKMEHKVGDIILEYFHRRFPQYFICLYNTIKKESISIDEKGVVRKIKLPLKKLIPLLDKNRKKIEQFNEIQFSNEELYKNFYKSQFIKERENRKYFKKIIPKNCMNLPGMKGGTEKRFRNHLLDEFIKK